MNTNLSISWLVMLTITMLLSAFTNSAYADSITVGNTPTGVGVNSVSNIVYVSNQASNTVSVIDGSTKTVIATIPVGISPFRVTVNPLANLIYVANLGSNSISVIDGSTNTVIATIPVGTNPFGAAINLVTNILYAPNSFDNNVSVIDGATNTVITTIPVGFTPTAAIVNGNTNKIYVANLFSNAVSVIDGVTNTVIATIPIAGGPVGGAANTNTNKIYVANIFAGTVAVIDGSSDSVITQIPLGNGQFGIGAVAVDESINRVYVSIFSSNALFIMDGSTDTVIGAVEVGLGPRGVDVNPDTDEVYVTNSGDNTISVFDFSGNVPPLANAGVGQTVIAGSIVTLDGTASSDIDGDTLSYLWQQTTGPAVTLSDPSSPNPTFIAPLVATQTLLTFELVVGDGTFNSAPATVNILVNAPTTFPVQLVPQPDGTLVGNLVIDNVVAGTTITVEFLTPSGALPSGELQKALIPLATAGNLALSFLLDSQTPGSLPEPPIDTALFFDIESSGIDLSDPTNFPPDTFPTGKLIINRNFPSENLFSDGCPVVPLVLLNEAQGQWEQLGDPLASNTNTLYIPNLASNTVSVIDASTNTVIDTIAVGNSPNGASYNPNTDLLYVSNQASNTVSVIDASTNTVIDTIAVGNSPFRTAVNPVTNKVYVPNFGSNTVSVIDASTNTVVTTVPVGISPDGVDVNPVTNRIYIANFFGNTISVIDGSTDTVVTTIPISGGPGAAILNLNTNRAYVNNFLSGSVSVIDISVGSPTENTIIATIPVGGGPFPAAINTNTNTIYVPNIGSNSVSVIDGSTNTVIATIPVGISPNGMVVNSITNIAYVGNQASNTVSVIDGSTNTVIATIAVGTSPFGAALNSKVPNPVRVPALDVKDPNSGEILQCGYVGQFPHLSKFSVGGIKRPTGGTGGSEGGIFRGSTFAFGDASRTGYDSEPPTISQVFTESGNLKVLAQILDSTGVKDSKLIVAKNTILMQRRSGAQNWWEGTIPSNLLSGDTMFFKIIARDYNNNVGEYSGSAEVPPGASTSQGASFAIKPLTVGYKPDLAYSITASGITAKDASISPQITIKNTGSEPLQNIRLVLSPELKGKFLASDYAIKSIASGSEYTIHLKLNGRPNVDAMNNPIPYNGKVIISIDNRSPYILELSGNIPNESASLQSIFMKTIASKSEQRYKTFEKPVQRISEPEYEVRLGSGNSVIRNASDELIISNIGDKPLKNLRIITSSISDHFLPDQKNIQFIPAGSFVKVRLVSNLNDAESRDLQGELLVVPEYGSPVTIPINIGKRLADDKNSLYEISTISGNEAISSAADGIMIRNNSEETIDNVRIVLPRELARVLSLSEDSLRTIEPDSEKSVYLKPRGTPGSMVKHLLNDYKGDIVIVSSDGMKKVIPVNIVWKYIESRHFVIYARDNAEELAKAAQVINSLERNYLEVTRVIDEADTKTVIYMTRSLDELNMLTNALAPSTFVYDEDVAFVWSNSEDLNMIALREFAHRTIIQSYPNYWIQQKISIDNGNWLIDGISNYVTSSIVGERGMIKNQLDAFIEQPASFEWYGASTQSQYGASYTLFNFLVEKYGDSIIDKTLNNLGSTMVSNHGCDTIEQCALLRAVYDANGFDMNDKRHDLSFDTIMQEWNKYVQEKYAITYELLE